MHDNSDAALCKILLPNTIFSIKFTKKANFHQQVKAASGTWLIHLQGRQAVILAIENKNFVNIILPKPVQG